MAAAAMVTRTYPSRYCGMDESLRKVYGGYSKGLDSCVSVSKVNLEISGFITR